MRDDPRERWNESDKVELRGARQRFQLDAASLLEVTTLAARAFFRDRNKAAATASLRETKKHLGALEGEVAASHLLELIEVSLQLGDPAYAREVAEPNIGRFLQDEALLGQLRETFRSANEEQVYNDILMLATNDIPAINRRGVQLFEQGYYKEAIAMFEKATNEQPDDAVMALNAAQALVIFMQRSGSTAPDTKARAQDYLDRAKRVGLGGEEVRYGKLVEMAKKL